MQTIITNDMTLEEKLAAIDIALIVAASQNVTREQIGIAPIDPASLVMCEGCQ